MITFDRNQEPLVTSKITFDIFLAQEKPSDLIALYHFYYYTAKWQNTNKVRATTNYAAKGLKWSNDKVRKTKKTLIQLGFIEDIKEFDENSKTIKGHYIQIKFIWESHTHGNPQYGFPHTVGNLTPNALYTNNKMLNNKNNKNNMRIFDENALSGSSLNNITPTKFDIFWEIYPNKKSKGVARTAWNKLCQKKDKPTWSILKRALTKQKKTEQWSNPQFIPYASTWLNQSRWLDDPKLMTLRKPEERKTGYQSGETLTYKKPIQI
jgi:hypothetical protein